MLFFRVILYLNGRLASSPSLSMGGHVINPKVSVIIPAYNAEKTLKRCLDSVFASDFLDSMEIILVNDGSTDETLAVAKQYTVHPNFYIINQSNRGETRARWSGICLSKGKFLGFVDADDHIASDMFSKMYRRANEVGADMVVCGVYRVVGEKTIQTFKYDCVVESKEAGIERVILDKVNGYLCNKLYSKHLISRGDYQKTFDIACCGDLLLNLFVMRGANRVAYLEEAPYYYVDSPDSVTANPSVKTKRDYLFVMETLREEYAASEMPHWKQLSARIYARGMLGVLRSLVGMKCNQDVKALKRDVKRGVKSVKLHEIREVSDQRLVFDFIMARLGLFELLYTLWESPLLTPLRKVRRGMNRI